MLYTLPMNIDRYVPFLIKTLDTIVRGYNTLSSHHDPRLPSSCRGCVLYFVSYLDVHFIFNFPFGYLSFGNLLFAFNSLLKPKR